MWWIERSCSTVALSFTIVCTPCGGHAEGGRWEGGEGWEEMEGEEVRAGRCREDGSRCNVGKRAWCLQ